MPITQRIYWGATVLHLDQGFSYKNRNEFKKALEDATESGCRHLIIDLRDVTYLDSSVIGIFALVYRQCEARRQLMSRLVSPGAVKKILKMANIDNMIPVYPTEESATMGRAA